MVQRLVEHNLLPFECRLSIEKHVQNNILTSFVCLEDLEVWRISAKYYVFRPPTFYASATIVGGILNYPCPSVHLPDYTW